MTEWTNGKKTTTSHTNNGHIWILGWWNCSFKINIIVPVFCFVFVFLWKFFLQSNQIKSIELIDEIRLQFYEWNHFFFLFDFISCFYYEWLIDFDTKTIRWWWWWWVTIKFDNWKGFFYTQKIIKFRNSFLCALSEFLKWSFHFVHAIIMIKWI